MEDLIMNSFLVVTLMFLFSYIAKGVAHIFGAAIPPLKRKGTASSKIK